MRLKVFSFSVLAIIAIFTPVGLWFQTRSYAGSTISNDAEIRLGRQAAIVVESSTPVVRNQSIARYVQEFGERLAVHSGRNDLNYQVFVLDKPQLGAFALPGGYIYVNKGMIQFCRSESELAAVLAHEISHAASQHNLDRLQEITRQQPALKLKPEMFINYAPDAEREADRLAVLLLRRAGINPGGYTRVLDRVRAVETKELKSPSGGCFSTDLALRRRLVAGLVLPSDSTLADDSQRFQQERWTMSIHSLFPTTQ